jgi:hypothetical protein
MKLSLRPYGPNRHKADLSDGVADGDQTVVRRATVSSDPANAIGIDRVAGVQIPLPSFREDLAIVTLPAPHPSPSPLAATPARAVRE